MTFINKKISVEMTLFIIYIYIYGGASNKRVWVGLWQGHT